MKRFTNTYHPVIAGKISSLAEIPENIGPFDIRSRPYEGGSDLIDLLSPDEWVFCKSALPHTDPSFHESVFASFVLCGDHSFGDLENPEEGIVTPGMLFMIEPTVKHWLSPMTPNEPATFVALQWFLPKENFDNELVKLIEKLDLCSKRAQCAK